MPRLLSFNDNIYLQENNSYLASLSIKSSGIRSIIYGSIYPYNFSREVNAQSAAKIHSHFGIAR